MRSSYAPSDPWYRDDAAGQGPGIVLDPANFPPGAEDDGPGDGFARRQDRLAHLNSALAEADAAATHALEDDRSRFFTEGGATDFAKRQRERLMELRKQALKAAPDPDARDGLAEAFDGLSERLLRRATASEHEARVRARAEGAERALASYRSAALADPDGLPDRIADAEQLLARMVEAGTDPEAAAERARTFRFEIGSAVLDGLVERDPAGAVARLDAGTFDGALDEESKASVRERLVRIAQADAAASSARAAFGARTAELDRAAGRRAGIRALTAGLRDGTLDEGHIARAVYRGEIEESDADALTARLKEFTEQRLRRAEALDRFDAAVNGDGEVDETRWEPEVVDAWVAREQERGTPISTIATDCFSKVRYVPSPIIDAFRTLILSAPPEQSVEAGREFSALAEEAPEAARAVMAALPKSEASQLAAVARYAHLDLPSSRSVELAQQSQDDGEFIEERPVPPTIPHRREDETAPPVPEPPPTPPPETRRDTQRSPYLKDTDPGIVLEYDKMPGTHDTMPRIDEEQLSPRASDRNI